MSVPIISLWDYLMRRVEVAESGCWQWTGRLDATGYGAVSLDGRSFKAHRVLFELRNGPVAPELHMDHLCRNRACVNPDHLEAVTSRINLLRGEAPAAKNAQRTECVNGHPFDEANTRIVQGPHGERRFCIQCDIERQRRYYRARTTKRSRSYKNPRLTP